MTLKVKKVRRSLRMRAPEKVDLMFRRIELRDMDLQYDLFDEKKLKDVEQLYTDK